MYTSVHTRGFPLNTHQMTRGLNIYSWFGNQLNHFNVTSSRPVIDIMRQGKLQSHSGIENRKLSIYFCNSGAKYSFKQSLFLVFPIFEFEFFSFCISPCWLALAVYWRLTGTMRIKVCLAAEISALSFMGCETNAFFFTATSTWPYF